MQKIKDSEEYCKLVSSRGILKSCDIYDTNPKSSSLFLNIDIHNIKKNSIVYICNSSIGYFFRELFPHITEPFILVSGDSDEIVPFEVLQDNEFNIFINNDKLIHWFAVNCFLKHPKMTPIPYGLDYHTTTNSNHFGVPIASPLEQENTLISIINSAKTFYKRTPIIYMDKFTLRCTERYNAYNYIKSEVSYKENDVIDRITMWKNYTNYAFILSPPSLDIPENYNIIHRSGGYDCIRTYEALILGCIPIVKSSPLDTLYEDLPVWIIDDWNILNDKNILLSKIEEFKNKSFNYDKLKLKYWVDLFNSKKI